MTNQSDRICATGRRKEAVASVRILTGTGKIKVNNKPFEQYFTTEALRGYICQPLKVTDKSHSVDIFANVKGGGISGQAGALRYSIARALVKKDESLRHVLKDSMMLTRDDRVKERKKPGRPGARKRFQFSKR